MNRLRTAIIVIALPVIAGCASYSAYQRAHQAERLKNWDEAVVQYEKALDIDPDNMRYKIDLQRARMEASRIHFEKGKTLHTAAAAATGEEQVRLAQLAATELQITVKLDPTNQFAAVEMSKVVQILTDAQRAADHNSIAEIKKRASGKAQPPQLNPASDQPISLSFPHETPVKDIYKALANAYGINIMFDQAVKNDPIAIELKDVTAQQALERVMQAANHFYKALDEHTIIIIPDNPQARRDYEDLVIRTFYLSNGDAEQVTNVVRTMLEARNVFPLKALNAITIRDTADKVRIAEKIIEANDKAKAEVVVDIELLQLDADRTRQIGAYVAGTSGSLSATPTTTDSAHTPLPINLDAVRQLKSGNWTFTLPTVNYAFIKSLGNTQTLANPELRISEGEKATLHIGQRVPVPVTQFNSFGGTTAGGAVSPVTSFQYQDVGIKVAVEPRVHHNREVTLKLTVEVSDLGPNKNIGGQDLPSFVTRTIEDTIRLKDGETNFLAGLIQQTDANSDTKTPFLGDIPILGRLFTQNNSTRRRTDLMLTMTPHIIRIPDITDEDVAPMWVGTQNNLTFRGVSPRIESQATVDPFTQRATQFDSDANPATTPDGRNPSGVMPVIPPGSAPNSPFNRPAPNPPGPQGSLDGKPEATQPTTAELMAAAAAAGPVMSSPRLSPQPVQIALKPGEEKIWPVVGMDLDGLSTNQILLHYDARTMEIADVSFGPALKIDPLKPPVVTIDREHGSVRITSSNGQPLQFTSGGDVAALRVRGGLTGDTYLVIDNPALKNRRGEAVATTVSGGKAKVE